MNFPGAVKSAFRNYATFKGRASRSEYWYWVLFYVITIIAAQFIDNALLGSPMFDDNAPHPVYLLWLLGTFLPAFAISARRMHDINRSGWWILIELIPLAGAIIYIIWCCRKGNAGDNRFGPQPLA